MSEPRKDDILACAQNCAAAHVRKASRAVTRLYADVLNDTGLEPTQYSLLVACTVADDVTVSKLAGLLAMDRSALARNLSAMEKRGLLKVRPGDDRRTRRIVLTGAGKTVLAGALPRWRAAQTKVEQTFGAERLQHLLSELRALITVTQSA